MLTRPRGLIQITDEIGVDGPVFSNQIQYDFYAIMARLLADPQSPYSVKKFYIEFQNAVSPSTVIAAPSFPASEGVEYYQDLQASTDVDYLRIDVASAQLVLDTNHAGNTYNAVRLLGFVGASVGVNGKPFNATSNSIVYGIAAVSCPVPGDPSSDLIAGRAYFAPDQQFLCPASGVKTIGYLLIP